MTKLFRCSHEICIWIFVVLLIGCQYGCSYSFDVTSDVQRWQTVEDQSSQYFAGVCEAIKQSKKGVFMVSPGDFMPPDRVYGVIESVLGSDYRWYPVVGNHDMDTPSSMQWLRDYANQNLHGIVNQGPKGSEETTYSFDYKNSHFIAINEYYDGQSDTGAGGDIVDSLYEWLENDLQNNSKPFVFVFGHEPFIAIPDIDNGRHRHQGDSLDQHPKNSHRASKLLRQYNVTAYICGHTHAFSHAKINGIWNINTGHAMGVGDAGASSTFLKVNVGVFNCSVDVYRLDQNKNTYLLTETIVLN